MRILYLVNIPRFFVSHRLPLALAARDDGHDVHVATSDADPIHIERIKESGLSFHPLPLDQHGINPFRELRALAAIVRLYRKLKPDLVHHASIKPVIYGGIAAQVAGIPAVVGAVSGLGYVFTARGIKPAILRFFAGFAYKLALRSQNGIMIFQNHDDRAMFIKMGLIDETRSVVIQGSGVDARVFAPQPESADMPVVLFAGRLLWKKGLQEFVSAAQNLKGKARFVIAGYPEPSSPDAVSPEQLDAWSRSGVIEFWGRRDDMPAVFAQSHIVCLPSTYGEGVPKVLIEAAACGRAIVTTDTPGCREIVRDGKNGLLVPSHDVRALTAAIARLIAEPDLRRAMSINGRQIAVESFSIERVIHETFAVYQSLNKTSQ